jgi:hypothetical protein
MRKLIVTEFISVDGVAEVEKLPGVTWNDEMNRFKEDELADSGAMLLGRKTYEIFAGSWPKETGDFAGCGEDAEARQRRQHLCAWQPQRRTGIAAPRAGRPRQAAQLSRRRRPGQAAVPTGRTSTARADFGHAVQQRRCCAGVCASEVLADLTTQPAFFPRLPLLAAPSRASTTLATSRFS